LTDRLTEIEDKLQSLEINEKRYEEQSENTLKEFQPQLEQFKSEAQEKEQKVQQNEDQQQCYEKLSEISKRVKHHILNSSSDNHNIQHQMRDRLEKCYIDDLVEYMNQLRGIQNCLQERLEKLNEDFEHFQNAATNGYGIRAAHKYEEILKDLEEDRISDSHLIQQIQNELDRCDASTRDVVSQGIMDYFHARLHGSPVHTSNIMMAHGDPAHAQNQTSPHSTAMAHASRSPAIIDDNNYGTLQQRQTRKPPRSHNNQYLQQMQYTMQPPVIHNFTPQHFGHLQSAAPQSNYRANNGYHNTYDDSFDGVENQNVPYEENSIDPFQQQAVIQEQQNELSVNDPVVVTTNNNPPVASEKEKIIEKPKKVASPPREQSKRPPRKRQRKRKNNGKQQQKQTSEPSSEPQTENRPKANATSGWASLVGTNNNEITQMSVDNSMAKVSRRQNPNRNRRGRGRSTRRRKN